MIDLNSKIKHNQFYEKYECFDKSKRGERKKTTRLEIFENTVTLRLLLRRIRHK